MRIYVSLDMEGIAGVYSWDQEDKESSRSEVRKAMADQIEWLLEGIRASEANDEIDEIVVADSHSHGNNLSYSITEKDDRLHLVSGTPRPQYMMPAFDAGFDVVFLAGYHAGKGTIRAAMDHTYSGSCVQSLTVNGQPVNEAMLNAAYAGTFGVPVGLITGDEGLWRQLRELGALQEASFVVTKQALSRYAVCSRPAGVLKRETVEAVRDLLDGGVQDLPVFTFPPPVRLRMELTATSMADVVALMPGVERLDGQTVELAQDDYKVVFDGMMAMLYLASAGKR